MQQIQPSFSSYIYLLTPKEKAEIYCSSLITGCNVSVHFLGVMLRMSLSDLPRSCLSLCTFASTLRRCSQSCDSSEPFAVSSSRLCRLDGTQVSGGEELVNGDYYVAVGNEEYKKLPYFELLVPQDSACRTLRYVDCGQVV